ncbi:MAG: putative endonuclease [Alphaproteobacteria bacterium]|jgi:putative endonuclease
MLKKSQIKGLVGEWLALILLIIKGYKPLSMNNKDGGIEGDIIAYKGYSLVLVEVKWRQSQEKGHLAVHPQQQKRLFKKLKALSFKYPDKNLRLDLVLIYPTPPFIEHIENAFSL